jgi:PIN domain nuclease of toxin-antitoxin system
VRPKSEVRSVLDASVVLVYLQREPGYERVRNALTQGAAISAVNLAEVYGKVVERGLALEDIAQRLLALGLGVAAFGEDDARGSAKFVSRSPLVGALAGRSRLPGFGRAPWTSRADRGSSLEATRGP